MNVDQTVIWAERRLVGFHRWPSAPEHRDYLAHRHRHMFHVRLELPVTDPDREIEFHDAHEMIDAAWQTEWDAASCETIAATIADRLERYYKLGERVAWFEVRVSEEGEAGARIVYV